MILGGVIRHIARADHVDILRAQATCAPAATWLDPAKCVQNPLLAVRLRRSVLMRTYNGDYHTDVFDEERLADRVGDGIEQILFWGDVDDIALVADLLRSASDPSPEVLDALSLGTHTTLPGSAHFGPGHLEVARTGSTHSGSTVASAAILWDLGRVFSLPGPRTPVHTISCVPRNRRSVGWIPGGTAIHRIHTRLVCSWHWGIAPFYIMAGGFLELLDYRELSSEEATVPRGFARRMPIYTSDKNSAELVRGLCRLNGFDPEVRIVSVSLSAPSAPENIAADGDPYGPRVVFIDYDDLQRSLTEAIDERGEACTVAVCDLEDERSVWAQAVLLAHGFRLTYISPPKVVAASGAARIESAIPLRGGFCRIVTRAPLVAPYYLSGGPLDDVEKSLADKYHALLRGWEGLRE